MSFADTFTIRLGDVALRGTRLTIREVRENIEALAADKFDIDTAIDVVKRHVKTEDGKPIDPEELSQDQMRKLIGELVLPKEGRGISDFIGLLC